tara:strand:- start:2828 stop:3571 length:744 start_codon:yes stop_codon:yes gene_type:complete
MAIDLDALRAKHEELNNGNKGGSTNADFLSKFMQLQEGTNTVRILPWKDEDKQFFAETKIHRIKQADGNIKNVHCRKVHGEACPLCDLYYSLWKTGRAEDEDLARQIKPRARYYMNVVDRETSSVKILSIGVILFKKIIGAILDGDFGDITDVEEGHDFKIHKEMEGQWPKYDQSQPRPKSTSAGSKAEIAEWMEVLHDVHALVPLEEYDEVKKAAEQLGSSNMDSPRSEKASEGGGSDDYITRLQG